MNPQEDTKGIDDILNHIRNPDGQPPSDYFRNYANEFFEEIAENRRAMGFKPYTRQDLVNLLAQGTHDEWIFRNDKRKNGEPYFTHPAATARLLVRDQGFTGPISIQGAWKHDHIEDHPNDSLFADPRSYQHLLELGIEQTKVKVTDILEEQKKIRGIVNGVSRFKRKSMEKMKLTADEDDLYEIFQAADMNTEDEITMYRFLKYAFENPLVVNIKGADRTHNTFDKAGIALFRRISKDEETLGWYIPMLDLWGAYMAVEMLLRGVTMDINPELLQRFEAEIESRRKALLDENTTAKIIDKFKDGSNGALLPYLKSVEIKPRLFSEFVYSRVFDDPFAERAKLTAKLGDLSFADLGVHSDDNLHQIVVLTNLTPELSDFSLDKGPTPKKFFRKITQDDPTRILETQGVIVSKFCSASGIGSGHRPAYDTVSAGINRGLLIKVFNRELGQLCFCVNDATSHRRSLRGHAAHLVNNESPRVLEEGLRRLLNIMKQTRSGIRSVKSVTAIAREELLKLRITVYSKDGDAIEAPQGATVLDLADKIHREVLKNALAVICYDDTINNNPRRVSLCEELVDGQKYEIIKDPEHLKKVGFEAQTVHPREILYCNPETRKRIRELRLKKQENCSEIGLSFLNDISRIFGMEYSQLVELVKQSDNLANTVGEKIAEEIAKGRINPLEILSKKFVNDNRWHVEVVLKHEGGTSDDFLKEFRSGTNFNKDNVETRTVPDDPGSRIFAMDVEFSTADVTVYEFMKRILRLHYDFGYDVNVISCRQKSRVAEGGEAAEGQSSDQEIKELQTANQRKGAAQVESSGQGANDQHKPKKRKTIFEMVLNKVLALF